MRSFASQSVAVLGLALSVVGAQQPAPEPFLQRHAKLDISIDYVATRLSGVMTLDIENWTGRPANRASFILHRLMKASRVDDGTGHVLRFTQDVVRFEDDPIRQVTRIVVDLPKPIAPSSRTMVRIAYAGYLTPYTEIGWLYVRDHIDTAFTIIRSDALAYPVIGGSNDAANRRIPTADFTYDVSVRVPSRFVVASGGVANVVTHADGTTTWQYTTAEPSPFLNVSIAPFDTISSEGVHIFYFREDSAGARQLMTNAQSALRLLTEWFGPQHGRINLAITEIPDGWGSQADRVGGIIQTAAAFKDAARANEMYHELSHLWNVADLDKPSPRWNEGLATFLESLLKERVNQWAGRSAYEEWYFARVKKGAMTDSLLRATPLLDYGKRAMTDWSYSVGAVMFAVLYDLVGQQEFNEVVGGYYQRFVDGGTTRDFVDFAKRASPHDLDLSALLDDWILTAHWTQVIAAASSVHDLSDHYRAGAHRP
jgi:hypothetical protein